MCSEPKSSLERAQRREAARYELLEIARTVRSQREKEHRLHLSLRSERSLADSLRSEVRAFEAWDKARLALVVIRNADNDRGEET
jgi:hypothetical protein